jgi:hypothetical protein
MASKMTIMMVTKWVGMFLELFSHGLSVNQHLALLVGRYLLRLPSQILLVFSIPIYLLFFLFCFLMSRLHVSYHRNI